MERFIDVRGQSSVTETVVEYRADLSMTVRSAKAETAMSEVEDLRGRCIRALRQAGLSDAELKEGAGEVWRPWYGKKKAGQEAGRKILLACKDASRLHRALAALEPIFTNQRFAISVAMRTPELGASPAAYADAQAAVIGDARQKAETVARAAGVPLGPVIQVEEIDDRLTRSGMYGDEDWRGLTLAGGGAGAELEEAPEQLEAATRTRTIRFRVRFALETE